MSNEQGRTSGWRNVCAIHPERVMNEIGVYTLSVVVQSIVAFLSDEMRLYVSAHGTGS